MATPPPEVLLPAHCGDQEASRSIARRRFLAASLTLGLAALASRCGYCAQSDDPAVARIRSYCDALIETMRQAQELGVQGRYAKLAPVIQATFDLGAMTRIAVGPDWPKIPPQQQKALVENFTKMTIATYANRFDGYSGERFEVEPVTESRKADRIVRTRLSHPDGHADVLNYLMRGQGDTWKAVDVYLSGTISELATRRSEFAAILKSGGPEALIDSLRQRSGKLLQGSAGALGMLAILAGCASVPDSQFNDPYEPGNRVVFNANEALDRSVIEPTAKGYRATFPEWVRDRVRHFCDNLTEPRVFVNAFLQVRGGAAGITLRRFLVNSTVGVLGLFDVASALDLPRQTGDLGQTLARWGVGDGPYVVLPFFGPSNVRDTIGLVGDLFTDFYVNPAGSLFSGNTSREWSVGQAVASGVDLRARNIENIDALRATSIDYYSQMRSITRQRREAEVQEAKGIASAPQELIDPGSTP